MTTRYRIVKRPSVTQGAWYHPQRRSWWTLGLWWPMTAVGELSLSNAKQIIALAKEELTMPPPTVVHEE